MPLFINIFFIVFNKFHYIVKVFDIISSSFRAVASLINKLFENTTFIFFYYLFIRYMVNHK